MIECKNCEYKNDNDSKYCNNCGKQLSAGTSSRSFIYNNLKIISLSAIFIIWFIALIMLYPEDEDIGDSEESEIEISKEQEKKKKQHKAKIKTKNTKSKKQDKRQDKRPKKRKNFEPKQHPFGKNVFYGKKGNFETDKNYKNWKNVKCSQLYTDKIKNTVQKVGKIVSSTSFMSIEEENRIGQKLKKYFNKKYRGKIIKSGQHYRLIQRVGRLLVSRVNRKGIDYEFIYVRKNIINAFAVPGGKIYVFKGLLNALKNEAQLAHILAHEISHVDLEHCIQEIKIIKKYEKLLPNKSVKKIAKILMRQSYSTEQEAEADRNGLDLNYSFGYSPFQAVLTWKKNYLGKSRKNPKRKVNKELANILRTHPNHKKRACLLQNKTLSLIDNYPYQKYYIGEKL